jgi:hypothetical protein
MSVEVPEGLSSLSAEECGGCHEEIYEEWSGSMHAKAWTDPILEPNPDFDVELQQEGVTCAVCHLKDGKIVGPFETQDAPHPVAVDREMTEGIKACQKCHVVSGEKWDTFLRLPPHVPRKFDLDIPLDPASPAAQLDVKVSYHLFEESRRKRIGYQNREPIHYLLYQRRFSL